MPFRNPTRALSGLVIACLVGAMGSLIASAQGDEVLLASGGDLGQVLVDSAGMTLYTWDRDTEPNVSTCYDACAVAWPPHLVTGVPSAPAGLTGTFATTTRTDGTVQGVYNTKPLHYFRRDTEPGQTLGQGVAGAWWVITADASAVSAVPADEAAGANTVGTMANERRGIVLTDGAGRAVYVLAEDRDNGDVSICYAADGCAELWPPVLVQDPVTAPAGVTGTLGTQQRTDNTTQLTYNDRPLYYYVVDQKPGDATGEVTDAWGRWFLVPVQ